MTTVTLQGTFHGTEATVRPKADDIGNLYVSERVARRVWRELCGVKDCACGGHWKAAVWLDEPTRHGRCYLVAGPYALRVTAGEVGS